MNDTPVTPDTSPRARRLVVCLWLVAFAAILFGIRLYFISAYGNATPFWDQWGSEAKALYKPWLEGRLPWRTLFAPHNVHRIFTSRLLSLGLFSANGIWNPLLQMVVNAALWVGTLAILVVLLDRATGRRHLHLLLAFALVAFGLPYGNENMLAGFQGCFYFFVFWSMLALWTLALAHPFSAGWWAGLGCGLLSFLSLGSGAFTAAAAAAVAAAQYATGVRRGRLQIASISVLAALFVVGVLLTRSPQSTDHLRATSVGHALSAWSMTASWPLKIGPIGLLVALWPALVLTAVVLRRPPPAGDPRWFLLAACAGTLGQTVAIAYGRATGSLASRYQDLYVEGMFVSFACALAVFPEFAARGRGRASAAVVAWVAVMLGALAVHTHRHSLVEMEFRRVSAAAQQAHARAYVLSGDIGHLTDKPWLHVPSPQPDFLAKTLDDPAVRSFLPANVAPPLPATAFASEPAEAFVPGGADPATAARDEPHWGSHGPAGPEATGVATLTFGEPHRGYAVEIPVIVGGDVTGLAIEVEQDGERRQVPVPTVSGTWSPTRVKVRGRPFTLHVCDRSPTGWIAVAAPVAEGRFDRRVARLLAHWDWFVLGGIVLTMALLVHGALAADA